MNGAPLEKGFGRDGRLTARATFLDGTEKGLSIAICKSDSWRPVHQIVVIP